MLKTIKEIYGEDFIPNPETALLKHYNLVLSKTPDDLTDDDICMLIRQEFFLDISIPRAIEIIKNNHSAGDNYDYCLLINFSEMSCSLNGFKNEVLDLISVLEKDYPTIDFNLDDDKNDYFCSVQKLKSKIS